MISLARKGAYERDDRVAEIARASPASYGPAQEQASKIASACTFAGYHWRMSLFASLASNDWQSEAPHVQDHVRGCSWVEGCKGGGETCRPAAAQRVPGTCPRPTSRTGSWCCSRRTGCTRTGRPAWRAPPCSAGAPAPPCTRVHTVETSAFRTVFSGPLPTRRARWRVIVQFPDNAAMSVQQRCKLRGLLLVLLQSEAPSAVRTLSRRSTAGTDRAHGGAPGGGVAANEVGLDGFVLGVEVGHVHHQVPDHKHVRQWCDL